MCRAAASLSRAVGICRESGGGAPQSQRKRPRPLRPGPVSPLLPPRKTMRTNPMLGGRPEKWSAASVPQSVKAAVSPIWLQLACQLVDAGVEIGVARAYTPETPQCRCRVAPGGATHGELAAVAQQGRTDAGGRRLLRRHCRLARTRSPPCAASPTSRNRWPQFGSAGCAAGCWGKRNCGGTGSA